MSVSVLPSSLPIRLSSFKKVHGFKLQKQPFVYRDKVTYASPSLDHAVAGAHAPGCIFYIVNEYRRPLSFLFGRVAKDVPPKSCRNFLVLDKTRIDLDSFYTP